MRSGREVGWGKGGGERESWEVFLFPPLFLPGKEGAGRARELNEIMG